MKSPKIECSRLEHYSQNAAGLPVTLSAGEDAETDLYLEIQFHQPVDFQPPLQIAEVAREASELCIKGRPVVTLNTAMSHATII
jgi:hypothetical protein